MSAVAQLSMDDAIAARDAGIAQVEVLSAPWRAVAWNVLLELARSRDTLTSDDLTEEMDRRGHVRAHDGRASGPLFQRAIRERVLIPAGFTRGRMPGHHADVARLYRSGLR